MNLRPLLLSLLASLLCLAAPLAAQSDTVPGSSLFTAAQIRQAIDTLPNQASASRPLVASGHYQILVSRVRNTVGVAEEHPGVTDLYYILSGHATLRLGGHLIAPHTVSPVEVQGTRSEGYHEIELRPGMIVTVPADTPHQIAAEGTEITMLVYKVQ